MVQIFNANEPEIPIIRQIAEITWPHAYGNILTEGQIRYMLDVLYNAPALREVMQDGSQQFLLLKDENGYEGFAAFGPRKEDLNIYKLFKLYVLPSCQGKGYGKLLIEEVKTRVKALGVSALDLNVNRYNPAKEFYHKLGFDILREEDVPIGPYWMNDYVMQWKNSGP